MPLPTRDTGHGVSATTPVTKRPIVSQNRPLAYTAPAESSGVGGMSGRATPARGCTGRITDASPLPTIGRTVYIVWNGFFYGEALHGARHSGGSHASVM